MTETIISVAAALGLVTLIQLITVAIRKSKRRNSRRLGPSYQPRRVSRTLLAAPLAVVLALAVTGIPAAIFYSRGQLSSGGDGSIRYSFKSENSAKIALNVADPIKATLYFGQLSSILADLKGQVKFNINQSWQTSHPDLCAETIVFANVPGSRGAVYAMGIGNPNSWNALELRPSQQIAGQGKILHQQVITPPADPATGDTWQISARLLTNNVDVTAESSALIFQTNAGSSQVWLIDDYKSVTCGGGVSL